MTRKQALALAIRALSGTEEGDAAAAVLRSLSDDLPLVRWSEDAIRDCIEQFAADHGRLPTAADFRRRGLPPHTVIRRRYGMTLTEWLRVNYPVHKAGREGAAADITRAFIAEYERLKPRSAEEFNRNRSPGMLSWQSVAKRHGLTRWRALLGVLNLPVYSGKNAARGPQNFRVNIFADCDFKD